MLISEYAGFKNMIKFVRHLCMLTGREDGGAQDDAGGVFNYGIQIATEEKRSSCNSLESASQPSHD